VSADGPDAIDCRERGAFTAMQFARAMNSLSASGNPYLSQFEGYLAYDDRGASVVPE
jgi:hypothetical protein